MNESGLFEQWLGTYFPRARVYVGEPGRIQRMTVHLLEHGTTGFISHVIAGRAWADGTWVVERTDWRLGIDGRLKVISVDFVRGMP